MSENAVFKATQWGIGHGGFHTQEIKLEDSSSRLVFRLVYDCGTSGPMQVLSDAIEEYVESLAKGSHIDLLVVSHYDADHVNGLVELQAKLRARCIEIRRVFAPMLTKLDAIHLAAAQPQARLTPAYLNLISDPRAVLEDIFSQAVVTILGSDDPTLEQEVGAADPPESALGPVLVARGGRISIALHQSGPPLWEIRPYLPPRVGTRTSAFYAKLVKKLPGASLPANPDALTKAQVHYLISQRYTVLSGVRAGVSSNGMSICLYSGPDVQRIAAGVGFWNVRLRSRANRGSVLVFYSSAAAAGAAWLGTGDARLTSARSVQGLQQELAGRLEAVLIVAAPHHAARRDSSPQLWGRFRMLSSEHCMQAV